MKLFYSFETVEPHLKLHTFIMRSKIYRQKTNRKKKIKQKRKMKIKTWWTQWKCLQDNKRWHSVTADPPGDQELICNSDCRISSKSERDATFWGCYSLDFVYLLFPIMLRHLKKTWWPFRRYRLSWLWPKLGPNGPFVS